METVWVTFSSISEINFPLKYFPHHFTVKTFLEIIQLITHILFGVLCCFVHPPPFIFMGGLQSGIWIPWSVRGPRQLERYHTAVWGREASRKWEWASLQTVWRVVEGRMLIKIINNRWKEKWITTLLSDQWGERRSRPPPSCPPLPHTPQRGPVDLLRELFSGQIEQLFKQLSSLALTASLRHSLT